MAGSGTPNQQGAAPSSSYAAGKGGSASGAGAASSVSVPVALVAGAVLAFAYQRAFVA